MKKPIYCNCSAYLGEREGFDVIRCKKCGIDYIVNPDKLIESLEKEQFSINTTSSEDYDIVVRFLESITKEKHNEDNADYKFASFFLHSKNICLSIMDNEWVYVSKEEEEDDGVKVIEYEAIKDLIKKELDKYGNKNNSDSINR